MEEAQSQYVSTDTCRLLAISLIFLYTRRLQGGVADEGLAVGRLVGHARVEADEVVVLQGTHELQGGHKLAVMNYTSNVCLKRRF